MGPACVYPLSYQTESNVMGTNVGDCKCKTNDGLSSHSDGPHLFTVFIGKFVLSFILPMRHICYQFDALPTGKFLFPKAILHPAL